MSKEAIGLVSGALCALSVLPYAYRAYEGKIRPQITSWFLWSIIGFALLVTYKGAGAGDNVWPAVAGAVNPVIITVIALWKRGEWNRLERLDYGCILFGILSIGLWLYVRGQPSLVQYALYLAITADLCASIPTIRFVYRTPWEERPFPWAMFALGYFLAIFAIPEPTVSNYALAVYMTLGSATIAGIVIRYHLNSAIRLREWI